MRQILIAAFLSAAAAFAAASWVYRNGEPAPAQPASVAFDANLSAAERIAALERAVSDERMARQLLQEELWYLTTEIEALLAGSDAPPPEPGRNAASDEAADDERTRMFAERRESRAWRNSVQGRIERLIDGGMDPGQAEYIVQREQELRMEALQERFEAGRNGDPGDFFRSSFETGNALREELGDTTYEQYLGATGRPTSVTVSSVIGSSPAQAAGLQPGDEILRYAGERVFSMTDLNLATMDGTPGNNVVVDIVRDGVPMQVVIPRGPLGITGGRRRP